MHVARKLAGLGAVALLVTGEAAAFAALWRSGSGLPRSASLVMAVTHASLETLVFVAARLGALAGTAWLLGSTLVATALRLRPTAGVDRRGLDRCAPRIVRRFLDRALAIGLGASLTFGMRPAVAASTPAERPVVRAPVATAVVAASPSHPDVPVVRAPAPTRLHPRAPDPNAERPAATLATVVVRPGDNLWMIAAHARLAAGPASGADVARYWLRVVDANRGRLRSGDPNLIRPGEVVVLPPIDAAG